MQHKILLLDELGNKWGKTHIYHDLKSPCEALKLLYINHPDLKKYFATAHEDGVSFTVVQAGEFLDYEDLSLPIGQNDLVITPVITGSGATAKSLLGVGLVIATGGISTAFTGVGAGLFGITSGAAGVIGGVVGKIGVGLVLSGVSDIISPQPQLPDFETDFNTPLSGFTGGAGGITRGSDGTQSYAYTGPANTVGLGKTIPVVYGKALIGGHILSTNIEISNESDPLMKFIRPPSLDSVRLNGEELKGSYLEAGGLEARIYNGPKNGAKGTSFALTSDFNVDLRQEGEQKVLDNLSGTADGENNNLNNTPDFQILFQVAGLVDFVGNQGTTKIDGFVTYRIIIKEKDSQNLVLNDQATIQGLTRPSQKFNFIAKLPYQHISGQDTYQLFVQIIDVGVHFDTAIFKIRQAGYNLKRK
tara:strand:- start:2657 stop:3907 length:1251 start_codon:yes stop_codon:yes gene_type:complete